MGGGLGSAVLVLPKVLVILGEIAVESTRDGAPAIDLIDGEALCGLLKDSGLGVTVREVRVEDVTVDEEFFASI